ncbi:hypothetical protein MKX01_037013 [Papaver californicum]|nr:hypothetical protein MKX01_037013 [Papaver californicum]
MLDMGFEPHMKKIYALGEVQSSWKDENLARLWRILVWLLWSHGSAGKQFLRFYNDESDHTHHLFTGIPF